MSRIEIKMKHDDSILLQAVDEQVQIIEGNYYVHPDLVKLDRFEVSDRVYNCPAKGKCLWVDLNTETGWINDICWVYPQPKEAYQHIAGWFGFYPSHKNYEIKGQL